MLILKELRWDNAFSYGKNNKIRFDENALTQLMGSNGAGKTSISLMLQEALYGKNIKNIKKQDIANNKSGEKGYQITLDFSKDGSEYTVYLDRKSSLKFKLFKNGEDISSHTSLNTYKTLGEIIGIDDFKVFCQLIYQHSTDSLDFLTATDTNRKKFLISLLQLDRYIELHEHFKNVIREVTLSINHIQGKVSTLESWIENHKDMDLIKKELLPVEIVDPDWYVRKATYADRITNINQINRKIATNKQYVDEMAGLDRKYYMGIAPAPPKESSHELRAQVRVVENNYRQYMQNIKDLDLSETCPSCGQDIDNSIQVEMFDEQVRLRDAETAKMSALWDAIPKAEKIEAEIKKFKEEKRNFEKLSNMIDPDLSYQALHKDELTTKLNDISGLILAKERELKVVEKKNLEISAHNSKVEVVKNQLAQFQADAHTSNVELVTKENLSYILELLKKTFGTNGLVSYKIESSVKELEKRINTYLADLTHFQIYFKLVGEKLNIEVIDDLGNMTSISNLSSGERARVNIATILAIRSILSSLTSTRINLLFLDEVIGVIDAEGKEKLSEILLRENLNTFIVSHDWSHPLIPRINIIKENHISRIEHD